MQNIYRLLGQISPKIKIAQKFIFDISLVIRQKGESQKGCFKKTKHAKFWEKRTFLTTWYVHTYVRIRGLEMLVFRKIWRALFSSNTRFEIIPFALLPTIFQVLWFKLRCLIKVSMTIYLKLCQNWYRFWISISIIKWKVVSMKYAACIYYYP